VGSYPLLSLAPTPVEVELGCDNRSCFIVPEKSQPMSSQRSTEQNAIQEVGSLYWQMT
jgi:hypothetical protein